MFSVLMSEGRKKRDYKIGSENNKSAYKTSFWEERNSDIFLLRRIRAMKKGKMIAAALTCVMLVQTALTGAEAGVVKRSWSEDEIEKRIEEVGNAYIDFYRKGREDMYAEMETEMLYEDAADEAAPEEAGAVYAPAMNYSMPANSGAAKKLGSNMAGIMPVTETEPFNTEEYSPVEESGFISVAAQPFSTFGADVDTASYSSLRRKLLEPYSWGAAPVFSGIDDSAIRIEEMMNYFRYDYDGPSDGETFGVTTTLNPCPWNPDTLLFKVGIRTAELKEESKGSNIVFLIDTSGSMFDFDKLPLVKRSLEILLGNLDARDTVSIVTYAGSEEVLLEGEHGDEQERILEAVDALEAWGSTWGEGGINKAYEIAEKYYVPGGNNRVILCTDGDFNVGVSSEAGLKELISRKRDSGIFFSCLGFGGGNYSDTTMETLADNGNGNYFYIDSEREAERALSEEFFSTIYTVAKDTKFQVEFNPATVKGYRLIGYENRKMAAEDFADDTKDGGEVGAGQCVTVLYEVVPADSALEIPEVKSRYQQKDEKAETDDANEADSSFEDELLQVSIRYKAPDEDVSELREYPVSMKDCSEEMDADTSWAAGVAQAGMLMRDSEYAGTSTFDEIYDRLKFDDEIMENDFKAEFLFLLRAMKQYCSER